MFALSLQRLHLNAYIYYQSLRCITSIRFFLLYPLQLLNAWRNMGVHKFITIFSERNGFWLRFVRFPPSHLLIKSGYPKDLSNRKIFDYPNSDFSSGSVTNNPSLFLACWPPKGCIFNFQLITCEVITIFRKFWKIFCRFVRFETFYWDFASFAIKKMINFASDQRGRHSSGKVMSNRMLVQGVH